LRNQAASVRGFALRTGFEADYSLGAAGAPETEEGGVAFHGASELEPRHWQGLQRTVQKRVLRYFHRHDLLHDSTTADMLTWQSTGGAATKPLRRPAHGSSIGYPIPRPTGAASSSCLRSNSSSDSPGSSLHHRSTATDITEFWPPTPASGLR
jgi:hypothetical protein